MHIMWFYCVVLGVPPAASIDIFMRFNRYLYHSVCHRCNQLVAISIYVFAYVLPILPFPPNADIRVLIRISCKSGCWSTFYISSGWWILALLSQNTKNGASSFVSISLRFCVWCDSRERKAKSEPPQLNRRLFGSISGHGNKHQFDDDATNSKLTYTPNCFNRCRSMQIHCPTNWTPA